MSKFSTNEVCVVSQDNYYRLRDEQVIDERGIRNFDRPESIDREQFHRDVMRVKRGERIERKEYTYNNPGVQPVNLIINPAPVLIIEGLFVQFFEEIDRELDLRIFMEARAHLKLSRRITRDDKERGYALDDVLYRYEHHVMPVYERLIEPLKHRADLVIPNNGYPGKALDVLAKVIRAQLMGLV